MGKILIAVLSLAILCIAVTISMNYYFTGENKDENFTKAMDKAWDFIATDEDKAVIAANEKAVMQAMVQYVSAQKAYHKKGGWYSNVFVKLDIPPAMAAATHQSFINGGDTDDEEASCKSLSERGYQGYLFSHVPKNGTSDMNYRDSFVLCAVPVLYRCTGSDTFAIGPKGIILRSDTMGIPVYNATEFSDGSWKTE